jgi:hypothetical protein
MMPIAVAHAEAAAKTAGLTIGEWLAQLIAGNTPASSETDRLSSSRPASAAPESTDGDGNSR